MARRPRTVARDLLRTYQVADGDMILIKHGTPEAEKRVIDALARKLSASGRQKCIILSVESVEHIIVLNEEDMNKHGWFRENQTDKQ